MIKLKTFKTIAALALACGSFSACQDYTEFTEADMQHQKDLQNYTDAFEARFGKIDPNHTWGMDDVIRCMESVDGNSYARTRAGETPETPTTGVVNINVNEWVKHNNVQGGGGQFYGPYDNDALAHDIVIPGWPHLNGLYYASSNGGALSYAKRDTELSGGDRPCGDITEYEIQYVSSWFRTHRITNPEDYRENLHLSDFFIQNVCADQDQVRYDNIETDPKRCTVGFNGENSEFATDTRQYDNVTIKQNGSNERINYKLDQLCFKAIGGSDDPNVNSNGWTHALNFNNGNVNWNPEKSSSNQYREILYITSSGTEDFACRSSMNSNNSAWTKNWVLVHLTWTETVKDPKSPYKDQEIPREGYYLAFDFETETNQTKVVGDGFYSNWIIKITPGHFAETSGAYRVFCEDLGGGEGSIISDFDFNDAVFDVGFDKNGQTIVTVHATGATMPIYIGFDPRDGSGNYAPSGLVPNYEIHNLLGNVSGHMKQINVKDDEFNTHAPAIFRGRTYANLEDRKLSNLSMYVYNTKNGTVYPLNSNKYDRMGFDDPKDADAHNQYKAKGLAPRAFGIKDTNVKWMKEYIGMDEGYPTFAGWCSNPGGQTATGSAWYKTITDQQTKLYTSVVHTDGSISGNEVVPSTWIDLTIPSEPSIYDVSSLIKLRAYTGQSPIWQVINALEDPKHQITFTVVMTSELTVAGDETLPFQCIMIPADYDQGTNTITYQGFSKVATEFSSILTRWKEPAYRADVVEVEGKNTYAVSFTFTKEQLHTVLNQQGKDDKLSDYLLLYIKKTDGTVKPTDVTVNKWFVHY